MFDFSQTIDLTAISQLYEIKLILYLEHQAII